MLPAEILQAGLPPPARAGASEASGNPPPESVLPDP